jgi:dihydroorotate dehydrogenase
MKIGAMEVKPAWSASGAQGFFGEGYWYHKITAVFGMWFLFTSFVAKTSTLLKRSGNMLLGNDGITATEWIPRCVIVKWWKRVVLNAVSLSGPGIDDLLSRNEWQKRKKPFFISLMSVAGTLEEQAEEIRQAIRKIIAAIKRGEFRTKIGIQLNISCPNADVKHKNIVITAIMLLNIIAEEDPDRLLTVVVKVAPTITAFECQAITEHPHCDGLCIGNTVPFGELPDDIDWVYYFGTADPKESPLAKRGFQPGGLSGKPLLPIVCRLIREVRKLGVRKHINACGGILGPISAWKALHAGADSISIGSSTMLAPWGVLPAIIMSHVVTWWRSKL